MAIKRLFENSLTFVLMSTASFVQLMARLKHHYAMAFNDMFLVLKICHEAPWRHTGNRWYNLRPLLTSSHDGSYWSTSQPALFLRKAILEAREEESLYGPKRKVKFFWGKKRSAGATNRIKIPHYSVRRPLIVKGKIIPLQAWRGPEAPRFRDNQHTKVVRLSAQRTGRLYLPGNIPGTHFC